VTTRPAPLVELAGVSKGYFGLRPLRIDALTVAAGDRLAILGLDAPAAETFVNLVTGAVLPEQGDVLVFGRATAAIGDSAEWLAVVDRFGIVSARAVLLDALTVVQNLALPFTLDIEPPPDEVRDLAVGLAREVGVAEAAWTRPVVELGEVDRVRLRLGRALALDPALVILEHVSAGVPRHQVARLGAELRETLSRRGAASVALTMDRQFAATIGSQVLTLDPATGRLAGRRRWF
jgi:ABC-type transporter Mla maintaining outer membrane lipid asymmetry ATPase subunit MlaF